MSDRFVATTDAGEVTIFHPSVLGYAKFLDGSVNVFYDNTKQIKVPASQATAWVNAWDAFLGSQRTYDKKKFYMPVSLYDYVGICFLMNTVEYFTKTSTSLHVRVKMIADHWGLQVQTTDSALIQSFINEFNKL